MWENTFLKFHNVYMILYICKRLEANQIEKETDFFYSQLDCDYNIDTSHKIFYIKCIIFKE